MHRMSIRCDNDFSFSVRIWSRSLSGLNEAAMKMKKKKKKDEEMFEIEPNAIHFKIESGIQTQTQARTQRTHTQPNG